MTDATPPSVLLGVDPAPPKAPASTGQDTLSPETTAAQATIAELTADPDFRKAYVAGSVEAKARMEALHRAAYPETVGDDAPMSTTPAEAARAKINALRNDPDFVARIEQGDAAAHAELANLDAQAAEPPLPFSFGEDTPIA